MTKKIIIFIVGPATGERSPFAGKYLTHYDPDTEPLNGIIRVSDDKRDALRFADVAEASECWRRQSRTMPLRPYDLRPNRPLTAYTITFETIEAPD